MKPIEMRSEEALQTRGSCEVGEKNANVFLILVKFEILYCE